MGGRVVLARSGARARARAAAAAAALAACGADALLAGALHGTHRRARGRAHIHRRAHAPRAGRAVWRPAAHAPSASARAHMLRVCRMYLKHSSTREPALNEVKMN